MIAVLNLLILTGYNILTEGFFEPLEDTYYNKRACIDVILRQFNVQGLFGLGIEDENIPVVMGRLFD